jgi:hypothetical protein
VVTDTCSANAIPAAPRIHGLERALGDVWHALRGGGVERHHESPATELCGELAEFMGMLGEDD